MFSILTLTTLLTASIANGPAVQFTNDSVYTNTNIISYEVIETAIPDSEEVSKSLVFKEKQLLGYCIYDNPDTVYIDGLKFDEEWVVDWTVPNYDDTVEHTLKIRTVYTDDTAGMLMAAKQGDWSKVLSNPLIILQIVYYVLAAASILGGMFIAVKSKGKAAKTTNQFASEFNTFYQAKMDVLAQHTESTIEGYVEQMIVPVYKKMQAQHKDLISALILSQSGDKDSKLAFINLLQETANEDVSTLVETIKKGIKDASAVKDNAKNTIKEIAEGNFDKKDEVRF